MSTYFSTSIRARICYCIRGALSCIGGPSELRLGSGRFECIELALHSLDRVDRHAIARLVSRAAGAVVVDEDLGCAVDCECVPLNSRTANPRGPQTGKGSKNLVVVVLQVGVQLDRAAKNGL